MYKFVIHPSACNGKDPTFCPTSLCVYIYDLYIFYIVCAEGRTADTRPIINRPRAILALVISILFRRFLCSWDLIMADRLGGLFTGVKSSLMDKSRDHEILYRGNPA
jgi:hypothetical protein